MVRTLLRALPGAGLFVSPVRGAEDVLSFQHDPVEYYGARLLVGLLTLAIVLLAFNLLRYRGRTESPFSWGLLIAGVAVLPAMSVLFGTLLVFQRAERVAFCASCHLAMRPYVQDMQNVRGPGLAALHYRNRYIPANQCYSCHTSYGLFGDVQAKVAGLVDVQKYYTRSFGFPLKMRAPYSNRDCLKCHAESLKWSSAHTDFRDSIFNGKMSCMGCHGAAHAVKIIAD